jgi:hypothetical protein
VVTGKFPPVLVCCNKKILATQVRCVGVKNPEIQTDFSFLMLLGLFEPLQLPEHRKILWLCNNKY